MAKTGLTLWMLIALIAALLAEGVISHTPVRHVIQAAPAALAVVIVLSGKGDGQRFASAVFSIWVLIVLLIWLYLLGIANIINGTFSLAERALTVVMGVYVRHRPRGVARSGQKGTDLAECHHFCDWYRHPSGRSAN